LDKADLNNSIDAIEQAISIGQKYPEKLGVVANSYRTLASTYTSVGNYEKAIVTANLGYSNALRAKRPDLIVANLIEKAQALIELNRLNESEQALKEALSVATVIEKYSMIGNIYSLLAEINRKLDKQDQVITFYQRSFENHKTANFNYGCGQAAADLGYYYANHLHNLGKSREQYNIALHYIDRPVEKAMITGFIGATYRQQGDFQRALIYGRDAFRIANLITKNDQIKANPHAKMIRSVLDKSAVLTIIQDRADTWLAYAKHTNNDKSKLNQALKTYMLADTMIDYMRWEHTGNVSKLFWRDKTRAMYERAIEACYLLNDAEKAFYFFEKSRAVMLNDQLNELGAKQLLSAKDQAQERILKQKVTDIQNKLVEAENDKKAEADLRIQLFAAQEAQEKYIRQLEKRSPQYYAYKYDNRVPSISGLRQEVLANNQTFVSYFVGDSALYGLTISAENVNFKSWIFQDIFTTMRSFKK
jgi:hypothetical protein